MVPGAEVGGAATWVASFNTAPMVPGAEVGGAAMWVASFNTAPTIPGAEVRLEVRNPAKVNSSQEKFKISNKTQNNQKIWKIQIKTPNAMGTETTTSTKWVSCSNPFQRTSNTF